jgi:hypothetical protein
MVDYDFDFLVGILGMAGVFICTAALWSKPRQQFEEYFGVYKGGLRHLRASVFRKHQTILGGAVLMVALLLHQFRDLLADHAPGGYMKGHPWPLFAFLWLASVATLCLVLGFSVRRFSQWQFRRIIRDIVTEHSWPFAKNRQLTLEIGALLGVPRKDDDTIETYIGRLRAGLSLPPEKSGDSTTAPLDPEDDSDR